MIIRHFKFWAFLLGFILVALLIYSGVVLFTGGCAYRNNCQLGGRAEVAHTPISTLIPATLQPNVTPVSIPSSSENCTANAEILLSAWVTAGHPESQLFQFTDINNVACGASFTDLQPLFSQPNLWYQGGLPCIDCHNANLAPASSAGLDLSSFSGVSAGAQGQDILGGGNWNQSILYQVLFINHKMPYGIPTSAVTQSGPVILAGLPESVINATPTVTPTVETARPNTPGGPGEAINLTGDPNKGEQIFVAQCQMCHGAQGTDNILNPGSDDGTVPALNPIDSTIVDGDPQTFAYNADLFIQNGSRPAGINPARLMPPWGTGGGLTQQQIADVIAYIISLNK